MLLALLLAATLPSTVDQLAWLAGSWGGADGKVENEEVWLAPKGGTMLAVHRDVRDGKASGFEFLRIEETPTGLVYKSMPMGRPATDFPLVEAGPEKLVFERPADEFPKRVLYWREGGALHARIEGTIGGKPKAKDWVWSRR